MSKHSIIFLKKEKDKDGNNFYVSAEAVKLAKNYYLLEFKSWDKKPKTLKDYKDGYIDKTAEYYSSKDIEQIMKSLAKKGFNLEEQK